MRQLSWVMAALIAASPVWADDRGVIIANADYRHGEAVAQPATDALGAALAAAGFAVAAGTDMAIGQLRGAVADLLRPDPEPGARLVLLSGHFLHGAGDAWFMGVDADNPDLLEAGAQGVSLSVLMGVLRAAGTGAVLLLGADATDGLAQGAGLRAGAGPLVPPPGVTVISGPPEAVIAAAEALARPGTPVAAVLAADGRLTMAEGGDGDLVLVGPASAGASAATPAATPEPAGVADRDLWAQAAASDREGDYRDYLAAYPDGLYAEAARARLAGLESAAEDRDLWAQAAATNTLAAYEDYLTRYPEGEFAAAARKRRDGLRPAAVPAPAPPAMQATPPAPQAAPGQAAEARLGLSRADRVTIQRRLNALGHATGGADGIFGSRSRQAIRDWQRQNGYAVTGYLTGEQIALMRDQANALTSQRDRDDDAYWQRTGAKGGEADLRAYLDRYPEGRHARAARDELARIEAGTAAGREQRAWDQARRADTVQSYTAYLQNWPRGAHADQARQRLDRLLSRGILDGNPLQISPEAIIRELLK